MPKLNARRRITLSADQCKQAGIQPGDMLKICIDKNGRMILVKQNCRESIHTPFSKFSTHQRKRLALMLTQLFEHWQLPTRDRLALLGLPETNRTALSRYRNGKPLPAIRDLVARVSYLLGIHRSLRLLFPHNRDLAYGWMSTPNLAFDDISPVETVRTHGYAGLQMVSSYLDRQCEY